MVAWVAAKMVTLVVADARVVAVEFGDSSLEAAVACWVALARLVVGKVAAHRAVEEMGVVALAVGVKVVEGLAMEALGASLVEVVASLDRLRGRLVAWRDEGMTEECLEVETH